MPDDTLDLTTEWLVMIAVGLIAVVLGRHGLWELSLVATAIGAVLFLVLLAHEIDPARHCGRSAARTSPDNALRRGILAIVPTNGDRAVPFLAHDHPRLKGDTRCRFVLVSSGMNCTPTVVCRRRGAFGVGL